MKLKTKAVLIALMILATVLFVTGCGREATPYETNNSENYTVSVKYDANGGFFTTNTSVIVDSYNISEMKTNSEGNVEIALLSPDSSNRGNDAFKVINNGHFLAGWYTGRTEKVDDEGNKSYSYSNKWDFENDLLEVNKNDEHLSENPVITLYAAWIPMFEIEFYSIDSGDLVGNYVYDPTAIEEITVPSWNEETGAIDMFKFPSKSGYTFNKVYYDAEGNNEVETSVVEHPGVIDYETGTVENSLLKLYIDWTEGEWYRIYNVEQFLDNASINGNYEIYADLDFEDEIWPTAFMYGNFSGVINGNGHTMKNIEVVQTNNSKVNAGLFGYVTDTAAINDVTFDNVSFTIKSGTRVVGTSYGLFAGTISNEATIDNVKILNSKLQVDSSCYFGVDDYSVGLVCGMGNAAMISTAEIDCVAVGNNPETVKFTVNGNDVTIEFINE